MQFSIIVISLTIDAFKSFITIWIKKRRKLSSKASTDKKDSPLYAWFRFHFNFMKQFRRLDLWVLSAFRCRSIEEVLEKPLKNDLVQNHRALSDGKAVTKRVAKVKATQVRNIFFYLHKSLARHKSCDIPNHNGKLYLL